MKQIQNDKYQAQAKIPKSLKLDFENACAQTKSICPTGLCAADDKLHKRGLLGRAKHNQNLHV
jgi:hypothetical protein